MNILYQDEHLVVCVKPSGVLSQGDDKGRENMPHLLSELLGCEVFPVHRLDLEVSGVMVYAKTAKAAAGLSALVPLHEVFRKEYLAVLEGVPAETQAILEDMLYHDVKRNKSFVVDRKRNGVKHAKLFYRLLETAETEEGTRSLVRVRLYTGRTHQIRVQFASRGLPLVGDRRYGASKTEYGIALCSCHLSFAHPITGKPLSFDYYPQSLACFSELAEKFNVFSIPTLVILKDGEIVHQSAGARPKAQILALLED